MKQGWEIKRLEELAIKLFAGGDKPKVFSEHPTDTLNIPVYANGVSLNGLVGYTDKAIVDKESITISARGTIGFCCIRQTPFVPIVRLITIIPTEEIRTRYLYYALSNATIENNGVAIPQLTIPMIKGISIPIPPREEQERIVGILDREFERIDALKANAEKSLQHAKELFQSALKQELQPKEGWVSSPISEISENLDYRRVPVTKKDRKAGIYPYYGASGIVDYVDNFLFDEDLLLVSEDGANLVARSTPIAFSVSGKIWVNNHAHILRFPNIELQKYVEYFFANYDISGFVTGAAQPKLNQRALNNIVITYPIERSEQKEVVARLDKLKEHCQALEENYKKTIALCDDMKQALLRKAFNGEL